MSETTARRGRPATVDRHRVAATALRLFTDEGFGNVTMDDVAVACGVGRRTLFRLFPSKAAMVWGGSGEARDAIDGVLAAAGDVTLPEALDVVRGAFVASSTFPPEALEVTRQRLCLIAGDEELLSWGTSSIGTSAASVAEFLSRAEGAAQSSLRARSLAAACAAANFAALVWWAQSAPERDPAGVVDEALTHLLDGARTWAAQG
ncbi:MULTISPECIES: TetR family transcriptional regulator [Oerskovia]|uniref:TetR family transcriptional regulator n=1 Tax=Oerskovia merdavium TaxID=2762227 RepID=A0ABR8TVW5_9CELL|nr:TetR family transcriptional regulator [Oerskovia merdavium]MBD7979921.1 TetR family transcriptional regulator [Oerskovia merdavium]